MCIFYEIKFVKLIIRYLLGQLLFTANVIYFREIPFFKQKFPFSTSNSNFFLCILFYKISLDKIRKMCGRFRF